MDRDEGNGKENTDGTAHKGRLKLWDLCLTSCILKLRSKVTIKDLFEALFLGL